MRQAEARNQHARHISLETVTLGNHTSSIAGAIILFAFGTLAATFGVLSPRYFDRIFDSYTKYRRVDGEVVASDRERAQLRVQTFSMRWIVWAISAICAVFGTLTLLK